MTLKWERALGILMVNGKPYVCTANVRNEANGRRRLHEKAEVVRAIVGGQYAGPYMPRPFPLGTWLVVGVEWTNDRDYWPVKIKTNARQTVDIWELDARGGYDKPSGKTVMDEGYHLHHARDSKTTLGCGRIGTEAEARELGKMIEAALRRGEEVELRVV